jgi:hypothetical protein
MEIESYRRTERRDNGEQFLEEDEIVLKLGSLIK